jgi:hypothetical protein
MTRRLQKHFFVFTSYAKQGRQYESKKLILTFVPWIIFSARPISFLWAAIIALIVNIIISFKDLREGIVLEIGGCLFFSAMIIIAFVMHQPNVFSLSEFLG